MLTIEQLQSYPKDQLAAAASGLGAEDIRQLVDWLNEKDDAIRYPAFLLLQHRSQLAADVYPYWDAFAQKLGSPNSFQRNIGLVLLAENVRWDAAGRFDGLLETYLACCEDEKPITARQCIQSLAMIIPFKPNLCPRIVEKLTSIDLMQCRETMRKLLLIDILTVLAAAREVQPSPQIEQYFQTALTGGILDEKAKRLFR